MKNILALKILLQNPIAVIIEGIRIREQHYYRKNTISDYNLDKLPTIDILDLFPNLEETIKSYSFLTGTSLITDLVLLKSLAKMFDNCSYLEIGSWRGESIVNVYDVSHDCTSLTLSKAEMNNLKFPDAFVKVHGIFSKHLNDIHRIEQNSHTYDFNELNKKFDLIFIDGDHSYEGVLNDTRKASQLLKNENSIMVWHDYAFDTEKVRHSTLKAILDGIPENKHKNLYHVSNTMCAVYMENVNIPTTYTVFPSYPNKKFSLKLVAEKLNTLSDK